jgi:hypothetical protein
MTHFECSRPGQRNRSNFHRKIGLQSLAQKSLPGGGAQIFGASMPPRQNNSPAPGNELSIKWALCKKGYAQHFPLNAPCRRRSAVDPGIASGTKFRTTLALPVGAMMIH